MPFCAKCGMKLADEASFCLKCGAATHGGSSDLADQIAGALRAAGREIEAGLRTAGEEIDKAFREVRGEFPERLGPFCIRCGTRNPREARFCFACGREIPKPTEKVS